MAHGPPARKKTNNNDPLTANEEDDNQPLVPDGGWGWVVVFGSFMIHVITDGMTYSFGIFLEQFINEFKVSTGYTSWILSMLAGVTLCSGPITSSFVNRYGCRAVTIAGSLVAAGCLFLSVWSTNVLMLIITIGFGTGFGLGLIYLPAIVSVTMYFEKYRSLATGIAVCGSGFGTFVFAPLTDKLITEFGWRVAMMVVASIVLSCILFGILFRPLEAKPRSLEDGTTGELRPIEYANEDEEHDAQPLTASPNASSTQMTADPPRRSSLHKSSSFKTDSGTMIRSQSVGHSLVKGGGGQRGQNGGPQRVHYDDNHNGGGDKANLTVNGNGLHSNGQQQDVPSTLRSTLSQPYLNGSQFHFKSSHRSIAKSGTMSRPDILYQGSLYNLANYRSTHELNGSPANDVDRYGSFRRVSEEDESIEKHAGGAGDDDDAKSTDGRKCCGIVPVKTRDTFVEMMNFDLFTDPIFILFTVSNFCTSIGFNIPYVFLKLQAETYDIENTSWLLATIGIANTVGRIVLGYLSDKPWVNRLMIYNGCLIVCGIATAFSIFSSSFFEFAIYSCVFGFTIGAYVGLTSVILVDLIGMDKLTNAFGLLLLFQGIASLIGPPMAGTLYDLTKSYDPGFVMAGIFIALSGFILLSIPPMQRYLAKRHQQQQSLAENGQ